MKHWIWRITAALLVIGSGLVSGCVTQNMRMDNLGVASTANVTVYADELKGQGNYGYHARIMGIEGMELQGLDGSNESARFCRTLKTHIAAVPNCGFGVVRIPPGEHLVKLALIKTRDITRVSVVHVRAIFEASGTYSIRWPRRDDGAILMIPRGIRVLDHKYANFIPIKVY
ncbi:hypothetical protein [Pelagibaculum spongiae]|uniref:Lipoprotein n=1 Tax=Pelagibaculum spongiae TaxID=2080658 RepID=A0A2V1GW23_9GAMM|nr:hypothetical protein [Pelagibaculum spongiae]PVZ70605.1 hypothetical protein DC094_08480 [Pelagibaculum spongiae]